MEKMFSFFKQPVPFMGIGCLYLGWKSSYPAYQLFNGRTWIFKDAIVLFSCHVASAIIREQAINLVDQPISRLDINVQRR